MFFSNYFDIVPTIMGRRDIGSLRQTHFPDVFQQNKLDVSTHVHIIYMCVCVSRVFFHRKIACIWIIWHVKQA